jgi:predicted nicotinamide N-methyase
MRADVELREETLEVAGVALTLARPVAPDALIDEDAFAVDEFLPYWAELWPAALALAETLPDVRELRVVELGCGLGVPSLVAAARGADVTATDWAPDAIRLLQENAQRNRLVLKAETRDWRDDWNATFDLVLAADVLYERRNVEPLLERLFALAPVALVGLAGRPYEQPFLAGAGEVEEVSPRVVRLRRDRRARPRARPAS